MFAKIFIFVNLVEHKNRCQCRRNRCPSRAFFLPSPTRRCWRVATNSTSYIQGHKWTNDSKVPAMKRRHCIRGGEVNSKRTQNTNYCSALIACPDETYERKFTKVPITR